MGGKRFYYNLKRRMKKEKKAKLENNCFSNIFSFGFKIVTFSRVVILYTFFVKKFRLLDKIKINFAFVRQILLIVCSKFFVKNEIFL